MMNNTYSEIQNFIISEDEQALNNLLSIVYANNTHSIELYENLYNLFYLPEIVSSTLSLNLMEWIRKYSELQDLSKELALKKELIILKRALDDIYINLNNNTIFNEDMVTYFENLCHLFHPLCKRKASFILRYVEKIVKTNSFCTAEGAGHFLDVLRSSRCYFNEVNALYNHLVYKIADEYPKFKYYDTCYNAVEIFVDCLDYHESFTLLSKLLNKTSDNAKVVIPEALCWLFDAEKSLRKNVLDIFINESRRNCMDIEYALEINKCYKYCISTLGSNLE